MAKLEVSEAAARIIRAVRAERTGVLTISIDGGCCEGTAPHLYEDYVLPAGAHYVGEVEDVGVYVPGHLKDQYERTGVTIDLIEEDGSDSMSIETELGRRLVLRFR